MRIEFNTLTAEQMLYFYDALDWGLPIREQLVVALENTCGSLVAYDGEKPVGMLRLLGDKSFSYFITDLAVIPGYQGQGIGTQLIKSAESRIRSIVKSNWEVSLVVISTIEGVPFYEKMGFEQMPCATDGPGMFKILA